MVIEWSIVCRKPREVQEGRTIAQVKNPKDKGVSFRMEVENLTQERLMPRRYVMESGIISDAATAIDVSHA